jgi:prepilin-type N-terminal cleavage/methylation domain-containing protein
MKKVSKKKKKNRGFTLIELVFVIAIIVVLASIFLPLAFNKLQRADEASADASLQEIAAALTSFYDDLRHFPTCNVADCDPFPGTGNDLIFLAFGDGFLDLSAVYPDSDTGVDNWDLTVNDDGTTPARNNGANHLVQNDADANGTPNVANADYTTGTGSRRWRGPYLSRVNVDPWGRAFIAYVGAMEVGGTTVAGSPPPVQRGWILSAGPNNSLNTQPEDTTLQSDDRGFIFQTQ